MRSRITQQVTSLLLAGLLLSLAWSPARAQSPGKISGVITESGTGEPLPGCNVVVAGTRLGGTSGPDGSFFVLNVPPGKYDISASLVGYGGVVQRGVIVNADRTTTVSFTLTGTALAQQEIVVEAGRPDVEREKTSTSAIIRTDDVQAIAGMRDVGDVLGLAADITDGHFRGGRQGEELYLLQGMGITNPLNSSSAFLPIMSAVEEVEVITSGFGAQYGNAQSGVVNISMKEGKTDAWHSRFETRMRGPGRKHFGPSVFDPQANPYLAFFLDPALLAQFGHRFELLASPASLDKLNDSLLLVDDRHGVVHFHRDQARGKVMLDAAAECAPYRKRFEAILAEGCTPQGSTTLGL